MPDAPAAGVAVVTGGLRGLGARVARWLLDEGRARRVLLVGRTVPAAGSDYKGSGSGSGLGPGSG